MNHKQRARRFLDLFCSGNLEDMKALLADDLVFDGPFIQTKSAEEYLQALRDNPPADCSYRVLHSFVRDNQVNLIYEFRKQDLRATMSQLFEMRGERIARILLIFDSRIFQP